MNLLLTGAFNYSLKQIEKIEQLGFDITFVQDERIPLDIDCSAFDAAVCNGLFLNNPIKNFTDLKFIQATSAGLDRMPLDYIEKNNIILKNAKGVYSVPMAEWCLTKILDIYKSTGYFFEKQHGKIWDKNRELLELSGSCATIIGAGDIGTQVAKRLRAFDVAVTAVDIVKPVSDFYDDYYNIKDIARALRKSDIIVITLPLTGATKNMFNYDLLSNMKKGSVIVNMSRGGIINEEDLVKILQEGKIRAAALDVFENEPLAKESNLWNVENLYISPHNSFVSQKNSDRLFGVIYRNLNEWIASH